MQIAILKRRKTVTNLSNIQELAAVSLRVCDTEPVCLSGIERPLTRERKYVGET